MLSQGEYRWLAWLSATAPSSLNERPGQAIGELLPRRHCAASGYPRPVRAFYRDLTKPTPPDVPPAAPGLRVPSKFFAVVKHRLTDRLAGAAACLIHHRSADTIR